MNDLRSRLAAALPLALAVAAAAPASADPSESPAGLTAHDVIQGVVARNPTLLASLAACRGAALDVQGLAARYPFVLQLDSSLAKVTTPIIFVTQSSSSSQQSSQGTAPYAWGPLTVENSEQDSFATGAEIKKHLVWGTDLSLRFDATRLDGYYQILGAASPLRLGPGYEAGVKLSVNQPLLRGAGPAIAEADLRASRARLTTAELTRERTLSEVFRDALTDYWEWWYASEAVGIEKRAREAAQLQRDNALARIQTGSLAPADGLAFETEVATHDEDVVDAERDRNQRGVELARLLGEAERASPPGTVSRDGPLEPPELQGDLQAEALAASPQLRALESEVALAKIQAETAGDALRSRLDVDGYVQAQGLSVDDVPSAFRQLSKVPAVSAHVGLTFELPLDDTQHRAQHARAEMDVESASQRLVEARQQVLAGLESARQSESSARRRVDRARQTYEFATLQANAEQARFATGGSTAIQVLQAQDAVRAAELRVARARTDLVEAHLNIEHLAGRLIRDVTGSDESGGCSSR